MKVGMKGNLYGKPEFLDKTLKNLYLFILILIIGFLIYFKKLLILLMKIKQNSKAIYKTKLHLNLRKCAHQIKKFIIFSQFVETKLLPWNNKEKLILLLKLLILNFLIQLLIAKFQN